MKNNFVKRFEIKYILEILFQRKIFIEKNPILDFVLKRQSEDNSESREEVLEKIKTLIPGSIIALHPENYSSVCLLLDLEKLEKEVKHICRKDFFEIDLRRIVYWLFS